MNNSNPSPSGSLFSAPPKTGSSTPTGGLFGGILPTSGCKQTLNTALFPSFAPSQNPSTSAGDNKPDGKSGGALANQPNLGAGLGFLAGSSSSIFNNLTTDASKGAGEAASKSASQPLTAGTSLFGTPATSLLFSQPTPNDQSKPVGTTGLFAALKDDKK